MRTVENCTVRIATSLTEYYDKRRYVAEQETDGSDERPQRQPVRAHFAGPFSFQIGLTRIANEIQNGYWQGTLWNGSEIQRMHGPIQSSHTVNCIREHAYLIYNFLLHWDTFILRRKMENTKDNRFNVVALSYLDTLYGGKISLEFTDRIHVTNINVRIFLLRSKIIMHWARDNRELKFVSTPLLCPKKNYLSCSTDTTNNGLL